MWKEVVLRSVIAPDLVFVLNHMPAMALAINQGTFCLQQEAFNVNKQTGPVIPLMKHRHGCEHLNPAIGLAMVEAQ